MPIPPSILERVETFRRNLDSYLAPDYKETELRREFLDPLFEALGWDVFNKAGHAEAYKDVVHEDTLKISGDTKAPDYSFRIGGTRKFFVEAKKPSVKIKDDPEPAKQLRRYSWSAKLPLGIVTDFHEFAIYDTRVRPRENDKASAARLFYCTFEDYPAKWDEIAGIFAKAAVLNGSFDKYAATTKGKRGTAEFDDAFLEDMEGWRELLARNLALRNTLTQRDLNFAVQRILDRLIFLRIAEDRGIERLGQLQALTAGPKIYPRFCDICRHADLRYNSGLFHFETEKGRDESPDRLTLGLSLDDAVLKEIISSLYYPKSPYAFAVIPADTLGHVYEQFLGKVIHLTSDHKARIEEKPEVRKAGGVYYTPTYIVDYIVAQTVGPLVEGKTPKQVEKLKILDPACGSGSFLLGAYDYLLDWHLKYYLSHDPAAWAKKKQPPIYETAPNAHGIGRGSGNWQLTTAERKRILVNNLHGVDIDAQAVEVTKLSLLLKVLEGEARELQGKQLDFHRVLPDLGHNIKCGNSLIGSDFYAQPNLPAFDDEARYKINAFDWAHEFKPIVADAGGFDAVIGNPPYVRQESIKEQKPYFESKFASYDGTADLFVYFIEQGVKLLRDGGRYSIIVSSGLLRSAYTRALRWHLTQHAAVIQLVDFGGLAVFADAKDTYVCVPVLAKAPQPKKITVCRVRSLQFENLAAVVAKEGYEIPASRFSSESWAIRSNAETAVFEKICRQGEILGNVVLGKFFRGILSGLNEAFELSQDQRDAFVKANPQSAALIKPFVGGQDIRRYHLRQTGRHLIVIPSGWTRAQMKAAAGSEKDAWAWFSSKHPVLAKHLGGFEAPARKRQDKGEYWWELRSCDYYADLDAPKIMFPDIAKSPRFYLDHEGIYLSNTAYCLGSGDPCLAGILNSRLCWFAIGNIAIPFGMRAGEYRYRLFYQYMEKVPVPRYDPKNPAMVLNYEHLTAHVSTLHELYRELDAARSPNAQTHLARDIAARERHIDRIVYDLYGLTDDEIKIVEQATAPTATSPAFKSAAEPTKTDGYTQADLDAAHIYVAEDKPEEP
jgi:hypothetical protein